MLATRSGNATIYVHGIGHFHPPSMIDSALLKTLDVGTTSGGSTRSLASRSDISGASANHAPGLDPGSKSQSASTPPPCHTGWHAHVLALITLGTVSLSLLSGCRARRDDAGTPALLGPLAGNPVLNLGQYRVSDFGYLQQEYFFSGTAASYKPAGIPAEDGRWLVQPAATAPFTSRLVVIRPRDPAKFNGTVVLEWLNVTSGADQPAEWTYTHRELLREGFAYVGVSAQRVGIEGGASYFGGGKPLKQVDRERYSKLHHPGDAYSYDIFTQSAQRISADGPLLLGGLKPLRLIAAGESQSAIFLTTYINAIDPIAGVFDAFLIHSRFGFGSGLDGSIDGASERRQPPGTPVRIRADVRVPVLMTVTETDLLAPISTFLRVRQPDSLRIRTWEIAGAAHADNYVFGLGGIDSSALSIAALAAGFRPIDTIAGTKLETPINSAPQHHYVEQAAIHALNRWMEDGIAPPSAPSLEVTGVDSPRFVHDANGNVQGGVRSPWVEAPIAILSGLRPNVGKGGSLLDLVGTTRPLSSARLHTLYPRGKQDYLARFESALQSAVKAGFIFDADRAEIKSLAEESYPDGVNQARSPPVSQPDALLPSAATAVSAGIASRPSGKTRSSAPATPEFR